MIASENRIHPAQVRLGFGCNTAIAEETTRENYARNRRVEFVFSGIRGVEITVVNQDADLQLEP